MTDDLESRMRRACTLGAAMRLLDEGADEIARLRAGGCARDQRTTQFCSEAEALRAENERLAARVRELEAERDALRAENERLRALLRDAGYALPSGLLRDRIDAALEEEKP